MPKCLAMGSSVLISRFRVRASGSLGLWGLSLGGVGLRDFGRFGPYVSSSGA